MTAGALFLLAIALIVGLVNLALLIALFRQRAQTPPPQDHTPSDAFRRQLEHMERRLVEIGQGIERMSHLRMYDTAGNAGRSYELAHRMASRGASVEQVSLDCGLSFEEAELIVRLHRDNA
ncbi:MAG: hypothetical protein CVV05_20290 [Gammaproteobacteria bacterium HGW-Gammaproteobacteria-1]|jgi:hypothetical protein|nr:MAG: hypothetical protein CVV12_08880 [Gammaproteobacteria bacterium HGW-Gammaproteobacteria-2]PKM41712.1 MAG: hypothetical protein CVV05_20290 [Gammaproteobacteria bacterium HGW-Gammaproteobacteria-1]